VKKKAALRRRSDRTPPGMMAVSDRAPVAASVSLVCGSFRRPVRRFLPVACVSLARRLWPTKLGVSSSTGRGSETSHRDVLAGCPGGSRRMCAHPDLTLARGALALTPELPPSLSPDPFDRIRRLVCVPLRHARWPLGSRLAQTIRGLNHPPSRHRRETVASGPEGLASDSRALRRRFRFAGLAAPGVSESGTGMSMAQLKTRGMKLGAFY
jgi:hypothetical protein